MPNAIEEILRYEPPSPVNARLDDHATSTVHGVDHPRAVDGGPGHRRGRARRAQVRRPRRLRHPPHVDLHLTFGYGIHFCLGAAFARMEGRIGLEETLKRWPEWTVDRENAVLLYTSTVRGYLNLPFAA